MDRIKAMSVLNLKPNYTQAELRKSYRSLSKKYHPDIVGDKFLPMFKRVKEAHDFLMNSNGTTDSVIEYDWFTHESIFKVTKGKKRGTC